MPATWEVEDDPLELGVFTDRSTIMKVLDLSLAKLQAS